MMQTNNKTGTELTIGHNTATKTPKNHQKTQISARATQWLQTPFYPKNQSKAKLLTLIAPQTPKRGPEGASEPPQATYLILKSPTNYSKREYQSLHIITKTSNQAYVGDHFIIDAASARGFFFVYDLKKKRIFRLEIADQLSKIKLQRSLKVELCHNFHTNSLMSGFGQKGLLLNKAYLGLEIASIDNSGRFKHRFDATVLLRGEGYMEVYDQAVFGALDDFVVVCGNLGNIDCFRYSIKSKKVLYRFSHRIQLDLVREEQCFEIRVCPKNEVIVVFSKNFELETPCKLHFLSIDCEKRLIRPLNWLDFEDPVNIKYWGYQVSFEISGYFEGNLIVSVIGAGVKGDSIGTIVFDVTENRVVGLKDPNLRKRGRRAGRGRRGRNQGLIEEENLELESERGFEYRQNAGTQIDAYCAFLKGGRPSGVFEGDTAGSLFVNSQFDIFRLEYGKE